MEIPNKKSQYVCGFYRSPNEFTLLTTRFIRLKKKYAASNSNNKTYSSKSWLSVKSLADTEINPNMLLNVPINRILSV